MSHRKPPTDLSQLKRNSILSFSIGASLNWCCLCPKVSRGHDHPVLILFVVASRCMEINWLIVERDHLSVKQRWRVWVSVGGSRHSCQQFISNTWRYSHHILFGWGYFRWRAVALIECPLYPLCTTLSSFTHIHRAHQLHRGVSVETPRRLWELCEKEEVELWQEGLWSRMLTFYLLRRGRWGRRG